MNSGNLHIKSCTSSSDFKAARQLTIAYMEWLGMDLFFQDTAAEFKTFQNMYGSPQGEFLLLFEDEQIIGGVGVRKWKESICEMKRLYVYPNYQGQGYGRLLCERIIASAKQLGYSAMRLDTVDRLEQAIGLYKTMGFYEIDQYCVNPDPTARFFELKL